MLSSRLKSIHDHGGAMGRLITTWDWTKTSLGQPESWASDLQAALNTCLLAHFPAMLLWGNALELFYNDAAISLLGPKHPHRALGLPLKEVYAEVWDTLAPRYELVMRTGQPHLMANQRFIILRDVPQQEIYIDVSCVPTVGADGRVTGIYLSMMEKTEGVVETRRTRLLQDCAQRTSGARSVAHAYKACLESLEQSCLDIPAALLYVLAEDSKTFELFGVAGVSQEDLMLPTSLPVDSAHALFSPTTAQDSEKASPKILPDISQHVRGLQAVLDAQVPHSGVALPLSSEVSAALPTAYLVAIVSPLQPLDADALRFLSLLASIITNAASTAQAIVQERCRAEALVALDLAKTAFFSNVSHEFRTPLTLMLGPTEDALGSPEKALRGHALEVVHRNELRLLKLVNTVLDFSALEADGKQIDLTPTDLATTTAGLASTFETLVSQAGMRLVVACPALSEPVWVDIDMWEKIVLNLVSNAFKYTNEGVIKVMLEEHGQTVELRVSDTGLGISAKELPKMFERFHRVKGVQGRTHEGTGIGLALVRQFARLHGGDVEVQSTLGTGSTFIVRIPKRPLSPGDAACDSAKTSPRRKQTRHVDAFVSEATRWAAPGAAPMRAVTANSTQTAKGARIVLADDNPDMREYIAGLLGKKYDVVQVQDGLEALQSVRTCRPDLLLSDIMMPKVDGIEVLKELRADAELCTLPIILLSARSGNEAIASGLELLADDYLTKPFSAKELLARIDNQLRLVSMREQVAIQSATIKLLHEQEAATRAILELLPAPFLLVEPGSGCIKMCNEAARQLLGEDVKKDASIIELFAPLEPSHPLHQATRGSALHDAEMLWQGPSREHHLRVNAQPIDTLAGQAASVALCLQDVTAMQQMHEELRKSLRARDNFLCLASHELKTPLTSLTLQTQMVLRKLHRHTVREGPMDALKHYCEQANAQLRWLAHLVNDMLDVGRIDSSKLVLHRQPTDLQALVQDIVGRLSAQLEQRLPAIQLDLSAAQGEIDCFRFEQVVANLLTNAARYGAGKPVDVSLRSDAAWLTLVVRDHGIGVAPEDKIRIFERFERAVRGSDVPGLGLGLFIVRQIVTLHGGTVHVEDAPGGGSAFIVHLPRTAQA